MSAGRREQNKLNCKRWREKLKEDEAKLLENKLKNRERMRIARQNWKKMAEGNSEMIEEHRRYDRLRKRRYREKLAGKRKEEEIKDYCSGQPNYKRTTDKQYNLLKQKMDILTKQVKNANNVGSYKKHNIYWEELTKSLNKIGPPYRTLQQWKKVWSDFRRSENRRKFKAKQIGKTKSDTDDSSRKNGSGEEAEEFMQYRYESESSSEIKQIIKSEKLEQENDDHQAIEATFANEYNNEYSYPDDDTLEESYADDTELFIPDETSSNSYHFAQPNASSKHPPTQQQTSFQQPANIHFSNPPPFLHPPLQPSNSRLLEQTFYTLQNQMEHQTKLLEHLSQMSSTMSNLMERQVLAVEKQTEAIRRQASATESHTRAMNNFIDMIREKMLKGPKAAAAATVNLANNIL